jgi:hypothetical protein
MEKLLIRSYQPGDEKAVITLWQKCGLATPQNNPKRDIERKLRGEAESRLKAAGCPKVNLQIRETNSQVIQFYQSIGYKKDPVVSMGRRLEFDKPDTNKLS